MFLNKHLLLLEIWAKISFLARSPLSNFCKIFLVKEKH